MTTAICITCSAPFSYERTGPGRPRKFCSLACKDARGDRRLSPSTCVGCASEFFARYSGAGRYCSPACYGQTQPIDARRVWTTKAEGKAHHRHTRRARQQGAGSERFGRQEIYERDGWVCGICAEPVDPALKYPDLMSASLDHVTPLALGGQHSRANVQCAHFICNSRKTHRGIQCREAA
jgi:5-methylcytosine-specific restriction endonuclease McrA